MKLIIFDLDDTLYEEMSYVKEGFRNVARYLKDKCEVEESFLADRMEQILLEQGRGNIFNLICEEFNIQEDIKELVRCYRNTKPVLTLYEDAFHLLDTLKKEFPYIHTGIITDGISVVQHHKLKALGLEQMIDYVIATDDLGPGYAKPHTRAFEEMLSRFSVPPQEAVYIGDNPQKDFIGARKLGMQTIRIRRERGDHIEKEAESGYEADREIKSLAEVLDNGI